MPLNALLIGLLCFVIAYLVRRQLLTYQAILWWQAQQLEDCYAESEGLRDQTLQSLFGIRRQLEQRQLQTEDTVENLITEVHRCQKNLNQFSDRLFSGYAFDSLPLSLKEMWTDLVGDSSTIDFKIQGNYDRGEIPVLPQSLQAGNYQWLLVWIRKLLKVGISEGSLTGIVIECIPQQPQRWRRSVFQIKIQFFCQDSMRCECFANRSDLRSICRGFRLLTPGDCYVEQQDNCLSCVISDRTNLLNIFKL